MPARSAPTQSPLAAALGQYWHQSRRPLAALAFSLPLLVAYEAGVLLLGTQAVRNGADVWLRQFLDEMGFGHYFLLPVLTVAFLLAWHHLTRDRWRVSAGVLYGMALECVLLGLALVGIGHMQGSLLQLLGGEAHPQVALGLLDFARLQYLGRVIGFFGAGIYEEVLFRLMLLPPLVAMLKWCGVAAQPRAIGAVVLTSLVFSAAHYVGAHGDTFGWYSFLFRFLAGAFFAVLFVYRGFGIAAGTHALYDIYVGVH